MASEAPTAAPTATEERRNGARALPSTNAEIIAFLGREVPESQTVPLGEIEIDVNRSQVRGSALDEDAVKLYVQYFEQGEVPPEPLILYATAGGRYEIGHGAHTCTAALAADIRELEAYVLTETTQNLRRDISALANRTNGVHFKLADRYRVAVDMVLAGQGSPQVARLLGLPPEKLKAAAARQRQENELDAAEINYTDLPKQSIQALYSLRGDRDVMRELADLIRAAGLSGKDAQDLAASLRDATSPEARRLMLGAERELLKSEIQASDGGLKAHPVREKYAKALAGLRKLLDNKEKLAELEGEIGGAGDPLVDEFFYLAGQLTAIGEELRETK